MIYLYFAGLLFFLWWLADKYYKDRFIGILKWSSLLFIAVLAAVDVFMFIETNRLIDSWQCQNGTNCCIKYVDSREIYGDSIETVEGDYISGYVNSTYYPNDDDYYIAERNVTLRIEENYTTSNRTINTISLRVRYNGTGAMNLSLYDGSAWTNIYTVTAGYSFVSNTIGITTSYTEPFMLRWEAVGGETYDETFEIDQMVLNTIMTHKMYCADTIDTATLIAYHHGEYWGMEDVIGTMPYLMMFIGMALAIQLLNDMYKTYQDGSQDVMDKTEKIGKDKKGVV